MSSLTPEQSKQADAFKRKIGQMSTPQLVALIANYELFRREVVKVLESTQQAIASARVDLAYHAHMESDDAQYRTEHGWREVTDLLDDLAGFLGVKP